MNRTVGHFVVNAPVAAKVEWNALGSQIGVGLAHGFFPDALNFVGATVRGCAKLRVVHGSKYVGSKGKTNVQKVSSLNMVRVSTSNAATSVKVSPALETKFYREAKCR